MSIIINYLIINYLYIDIRDAVNILTLFAIVYTDTIDSYINQVLTIWLLIIYAVSVLGCCKL